MAMLPDRQGLYDMPFTKVVVVSSSYFAANAFMFHGSDEVGIPKTICTICGIIDAVTFDVRVYDVTNNAVIAELTGKSDAYPTCLDMGTLANIPQMKAIWEVQIRRASGGGQKEVAVASLHMEF